jgi:hypothetical protein
MMLLRLSVLIPGLAFAMWAQHANTINPVRPMPAPTNALPFGNILHPGGITSFPHQLGGTVSGTIPYTGVPPGRHPGPGGFGRSGHNRTVVVPYAVPVFGYGGYGYGGYYDGQQAPTNVTVVVPQQPTPSVIINQTFNSPDEARQQMTEYSTGDIPDKGGVRVYEPPRRSDSSSAQPEVTAPPPAPRSSARDGKPTIYLIALTDSTVRQAIGYWVEDGTLNYVTPQASINHVSLDMVDRDTSVQLNAERKLEFDLKGK